MTHFLRQIGLFSMVLLCLNNILGLGLFLLPGQVAAFAGNYSVALYIFVGLIVMAIAWVYTKCSSLYTRNGGAYLYAKEAFGTFVGFEIGLMRWAVMMIAWASLSVGFVTALGGLWPLALMTPYKQLLIASLIFSLGIVNIFGVQTVNRMNNVITIAKLLPLFAFVFFGIFYMGSHASLAELSTSIPIGSFGTAALIIFYAFGGFDALPVVAGEMKNPQKNIPKAMIWGVLITALIYVLVQVICLWILGPALSTSISPLADVANIILGPIGKLLVTLSMLVSIGGILVASSFITPRTPSAMAEDRLIFPKLLDLNRYGSPYISIVISTLLTTIIALSGSFVQLVTISVVSRFAQYISTCLAIYMYERKGLLQPFSSPWKRFIPLFALVGIGWMLMNAEPYQLLLGFGALILGVPLYFLQKVLMRSNAEDVG